MNILLLFDLFGNLKGYKIMVSYLYYLPKCFSPKKCKFLFKIYKTIFIMIIKKVKNTFKSIIYFYQQSNS